MTRPRCFNREPFSGEWVRTGYYFARIGKIGHPLDAKAVYRYHWPWFEDRCAAWDAPKIQDSVPAREGWRCEGCRWLPEAVTRAGLLDRSRADSRIA
jgi:hypothetical protein